MKDYKVTFEIHEHSEGGKHLGIIETKVDTFHNDKLVDVYDLGCTNLDEMTQKKLSQIKREIEGGKVLTGMCLRPYTHPGNGRTRFHRITKIEIS